MPDKSASGAGIKSLEAFNNIFQSINVLRQELHALENEREAKWHRIDDLEDEVAEKRRYVYKKIHGDKGVKSQIKKAKAFLPELILREEELAQMMATLEEHKKQARVKLTSAESELTSVKKTYAQQENELDTVKAEAGETERALEEQEQHNEDIRQELDKSYSKIRDKGAIIEIFDIDSFRDLKFKAQASGQVNDYYLRRIAAFTEDTETSSLGLQKAISALDTMAERVAEEAEAFYSRANHGDDDDEFLATSEYGMLKKEYKRFQTSQFDDKRVLLRRQQNLMTDMHTYFDEYRVASEFLFNTHAAQLGERLLEQEREYNNEICSVMIEAEAGYDDMVSEKDAKTLELIEGSDPAMQQMAHEMKLAQEKRKHAQRLRKLHQQEYRAVDHIVEEMEDHIESQQLHVLMLEDRVRAAKIAAERLMRSAKTRDGMADMFERECQWKAHEQGLELRKLKEKNSELRGKREYFHNKLLTTKCAVVDANHDTSLFAIAERLASEVNKLASSDQGHRKVLDQGIKSRVRIQGELMKGLKYFSSAAVRLKHEHTSLQSVREEVDGMIKSVLDKDILVSTSPSVHHVPGQGKGRPPHTFAVSGGGQVQAKRTLQDWSEDERQKQQDILNEEIGRISEALDRYSRLFSNWGGASIGSIEDPPVRESAIRLPTPSRHLKVYEGDAAATLAAPLAVGK